MGLYGGFHAVDPLLLLDPSYGVQQSALIDDGADVLITVEVLADAAGQMLGRKFADAGDGGSDFGKSANELDLVGGKTRFDEQNVHTALHVTA
jgi:hypothetical protein